MKPGRSDAARLAGYGAVSTALALLGDRRLGELVDQGLPIGTGIGGTTVLLEVDGRPVFVKRVPLTDLERRPEHVRSTANVFGLPLFYQYGVGSTGFGAWRELAAHVMTTNWVLTKRCASFPLLYHWRVLPGASPQVDADLEGTVAYWEGSPAVRERLTAIERATASVVLFLEYVPQNLTDWLAAQVPNGDDAIDAACLTMERALRASVSYLNANGLVHFDAHFGNILTDGHRLYITDFGLATSPRFELSAAEAAFLDRHLAHDGCLAMTLLVNWLARALGGPFDGPHHGVEQRNAFVERCAGGELPAGLPPQAASVIKRHAPAAVVLNRFYRGLQTASRTTPYPAEDVTRLFTG